MGLVPSGNPSTDPSSGPSALPPLLPSSAPSSMPSSKPSDDPSASPSSMPSSAPSIRPSGITEFQILKEIYNNLNGPRWTNSSNWQFTNEKKLCKFYGVKCKNRKVYKIKLENNGLRGSLPMV